jgi:hypothetical protein
VSLLSRWHGVVVAAMGLILALVGVKPVQAATAVGVTEAKPEPAATHPLAQAPASACPETWQTRQAYARVVTESTPLRIRATPNGRVIGAVPRGWAVVVVAQDSTGQWTKITSHFGDVGEMGFGSAPNFRDGWVATRFLSNLGQFCEKPMAMGVAPLMAVQTQTEVNPVDWLQLGDRIAQTHRPE